MPDIISGDKVEPSKSNNALEWAQHNVLDPALNNGPLAIYNVVADATNMKKAHLDVDEATPYSANWYAQSISGGVGAALPYVLAGAGAGKAMRAADGALEGTKIGEALSPMLTSQRAANILGASAFSAMQTPDADHTRFGNAMGTAIGFAVFDKGNAMSRELSLSKKLIAYPVTGFVGGAAMAEGSQFFSDGKLASNEHVLQSAVQGMALNSVMPLPGEVFKRVTAGSDSGKPETTAKGIIEGEGTTGDVANKILPRASVDLNSLSQAYSAYVKENQPTYPATEEFANLTPNQIVQRGFYHPDATNLEDLKGFHDVKPRPLPDAGVVASEVAKSVEGMPMATDTGDLHLGEWNMEFLTGDKAKYFKDSYKQIVPRHHLMFAEEANADGLATIAKDNGYNFEISRDNSRGQAVGFLIHPRLKVLGTQSYEEVANVDNIPDLRPAFRVNLQDTATGEKFSAVVVHLKSMRGGPEQTAHVRTEQADILGKALGDDYAGVIAGDWNTFLDKSKELKPLLDRGFKIVNPGDATSTQAMGGRLDGFLVKNMPYNFSDPEVRPFFKNPKITRGLSDHGLLTTTLTSDKSGKDSNGLHTFVPLGLQQQQFDQSNM
ncbi:MAG TPA: hypothetical protein V6C76_06160 [Drouetiella sp.]